MCVEDTTLRIMERQIHLKVRSGEHIGISPLNLRKAKPANENSIC